MEHLAGKLFFDPDDRIYADHFPGNPVVPGSLVVGAFLDIAINNGFLRNHYKVTDVRFLKFLSPGEYHYTLHLQDEVIEFSLNSGCSTETKSLVTGKIKNVS